MKNKVVLALTLLGSVGIYAQTGIGTNLPHNATVLEVASSDKGILVPRVKLLSDTDSTTINSSTYPESLLVYHTGSTNLPAGFYYWESNKWNAIVSNNTINKYIKEKDLVGDVSGKVDANIVDKIKGVSVSATGPTTTGQVLIYNATTKMWEAGKPLIDGGDLQNKANLSTDGVIVVGDAITGSTSSPNSVLASTTLSIKNASITGSKIADNTVTIGKIANGGNNQVLTTTATGVAQWEDKSTFAVNKSNLTTDGIIVVGDAATGSNLAANAVLEATNLSIKNASITGGKIASGTVTGSNIAANTIATGNIAPLAVSTDKMANGTVNSILTADGTGKVTWEAKSAYQTPKANLTTDGVIVVGDAATGTNSSANSVLAATTLSIKNASITGGKIASGTVTGGNIAANTVATGNIAPLAVSTDKMANGTVNSILTADGTGKVTWEAKSVYQTPKANLTTDGVIVVGDAATGTNSSANSVLAATTLSIKNASITGGKIASGTVTGGNIAANTVATGNIAPLAVSTDKMANGTINSILTADGTGKVTWEAKSVYQTPKANLTTGEGLVIGDANGAANTATGAVLTATTVNIKNGGITGGKIASAAIGGGHIAANAVNGTTHIANSTIPLGKLTNGTADAILTTTAAGVPQWQTKASIIPVVPVITANNGLTKTGNNIELGGSLAKVTTIATSATNQFRFTGLPAANVATDNVVMIDRGTGALKQVNSTVPNFFYLPPINIPITPGTTNQTLNVFNIYNTQYGSPKAVSTPGIKLPVFTATQLNYFVLYADPAVFSSIAVNANGVITYNISATAKPTGATFITVVLQVR